MKVILLNGSSHENGATASLLKEIEDTLRSEGIETEVFFIGNDPIRDCIGCRKCSSLGKCVFEDKVNEFVEKARQADGFVFASPFALKRNIPLVLVRKKGKLPGEVYSCEYELEYGTAILEVHKADVPSGGRILVVDDLIATGGTLNAARNVLEQGGAEVAGYFGIVGLPFLNYSSALGNIPVKTLIEYKSE